MTTSTQPSCATCILCLRQDYGYSNWTVEGTELHCLAELNNALEGCEEPAGWSESDLAKFAPILDVAIHCPKYRFGAPATMDVEKEGIEYNVPATTETLILSGYTDDPEAALLLEDYLNQ